MKGTIATGYMIISYQTPSYCKSNNTYSMMIMSMGMYVFVMSATRLDIQYAGRLTPETTCMCFSWFSRSLMMREIITQGINASAIETMDEKSRA